jgi:hypothetical protein
MFAGALVLSMKEYLLVPTDPTYDPVGEFPGEVARAFAISEVPRT